MPAFDPARAARFLRFELVSRPTEQLLPLVFPSALYALIGLLTLVMGRTVTEWPSLTYGLALALGGVAAAYAHRREMEPGTAVFTMLLPVTHAERYAARWFASFVVPLVGQLVLLTALANLFAAVGWALGRGEGGLLLPSGRGLLGLAGLFVVAHATYFAGGVFLRGSPIVKTGLVVVLYAAVAGVVLALVGGAAAMLGLAEGAVPSLEAAGDVTPVIAAFDGLGKVGAVSWQLVFPILLYAAAFHRARENEARG